MMVWRSTAAIVLTAALALAGCSTKTSTVSDDPVPPTPSAASSTATVREPSTDKDELASGRAAHQVDSGGFRTAVVYSSPKRDRPWHAGSANALTVSVSVRSTNPKIKRVYVSRATLRLSARDGGVDATLGDPVVDTANIDPGFLVTAPYAYEQTFFLPPVDASVSTLVVGVRLELVSLVNTKSKDYTKQTVTDSVTTVITS